jgi:hypothetical protein
MDINEEIARLKVRIGELEDKIAEYDERITALEKPAPAFRNGTALDHVNRLFSEMSRLNIGEIRYNDASRFLGKSTRHVHKLKPYIEADPRFEIRPDPTHSQRLLIRLTTVPVASIEDDIQGPGVYFATWDNHEMRRSNPVIKIGIATDLRKRLASLSTASPSKIIAAGFIQASDPSGLEAIFHKTFKEYRLDGEWFKISSDMIKMIRGYDIVNDRFNELFDLS